MTTKHPRPVVANGGTSEYIYGGSKSEMGAKRSFSDQEEDYLISIFCEIKSTFIAAKFIDAMITKNNPLTIVVDEVKEIMIAADEEGLLLSIDPDFLRYWITNSVVSELDHFSKTEGYSHE